MPLFAIKYNHYLSNGIIGFEKITSFNEILNFLSRKFKISSRKDLSNLINDGFIIDIDIIKGIE